jgi:hypothetical protein
LQGVTPPIGSPESVVSGLVDATARQVDPENANSLNLAQLVDQYAILCDPKRMNASSLQALNRASELEREETLMRARDTVEPMIQLQMTSGSSEEIIRLLRQASARREEIASEATELVRRRAL